MISSDRLTVLIAAGAIVATVASGQCTTDARFDDVNRRLDDVNTRIDDLRADTTARLDGLQSDMRELRELVVEALRKP